MDCLEKKEDLAIISVKEQTKIIEESYKILKEHIDSTIEVFREAFRAFSELYGEIISNKRVCYLAFHGKKRTRKKNFHRMQKELRKWGL